MVLSLEICNWILELVAASTATIYAIKITLQEYCVVCGSINIVIYYICII